MHITREIFYLRDFAPVIRDQSLYAGINLDLSPGEIVSIMGHSGCGKTSLFQALRKKLPCHGESNIKVSEIFSVFQDPDQLFPWFTVAQNLDLVCEKRWRDIAQQWNILDLIDRRPSQISVGQKQRFTLLRSLCCAGDILLCDEPLSAVDNITAMTIQKDFGAMIREMNKSCLWITHDIAESRSLGDRILVINNRHHCILDPSQDDESILAKF